jgi:hypothetical protein
MAADGEGQIGVEERILKRIPAEAAGLGLVLAVPAGFFFGWDVAGLVALGGVLAALSFLTLKGWLFRVMRGDRTKALGKLIAFYLLRLFLIGAVFSIIILLSKRKAIATAAGFSVLILVFFAEALVALTRKSTWKS